MSFDLGLTPDQEAVQDLFAAFFSKESPPTAAREAEPLGFDRALWDRMVATGATSMSADGAGLTELVIVSEQMGRAIAPIPLVEHLIAARWCSDSDVRDGSAIATVSPRPAVDGVWRLVPAGAVADVVLGIDGGELVAVRSEPPLCGPRNFASSPIADRATLGSRTVLGPATDFEALLTDWRTLLAATLVGVAAAALELGVSYAKSRTQFGAPIGSFQAVQHGLAGLPGMIDGARLLTHKAAWAAATPVADYDGEPADPVALASMAFLFASEVAVTCTDRSLHYHGGYGFSEEFDIQLYYRRARGWSLIMGDPNVECRWLADRLFGAL